MRTAPRLDLSAERIGRASAAERVAEGIWLVLLVGLPAAFDPAGALAFEPLKASILRLGAAAIVTAWLAARLLRGPGESPTRSVDVGAQPVVRAGLLLLGSTTVSTLLGLDPQLSFFGSLDRGMGWLSLAACVGLLISAADLWVEPARRERAITAVLLGTLLPCAYVLVQRLGHDPFVWNSNPNAAPGSSLGSPTFLGGYLVLVSPLGLYRVVQSARGGSSLRYGAWLALVLVMATTVAQTTIRGPLLGLVASTLTFALLAGRRAPSRWRRFGLLAAAAFLVVTLGLSFATTGSVGLRVLSRFLEVQRPIDSSSERLTVWSDALPMPLVSPLRTLIGFGPDAQPALFEHAEATVRRTMNQQWDRAHDLLLDTWLTGGLLGLAALTATLGAAGWSALRTYRTDPPAIATSDNADPRRGARPLLAAAVLAALVGHLVEVSVAFHTVVTGAWFFLVLALAASLAPRFLTRPPAHAPRAAVVAIGSGLLLLAVLATPAVADAIYGGARRAADAGNLRSAALQSEAAADWAPWVEELPRAAGLHWQQVARRRTGAPDESLLARAEHDLLAAADRAPFEPSPRLRLARLYAGWAGLSPHTRSAPDLLDMAEVACAQALANGPYRAAAWETCASVSQQRGATEEAAARTARAADLRPRPGLSAE